MDRIVPCYSIRVRARVLSTHPRVFFFLALSPLAVCLSILQCCHLLHVHCSDLLEESQAWKNTVRPVMEVFLERTPGSAIRERVNSLSWLFHEADSRFGMWQATDMEMTLSTLISTLPLEMARGNAFLEVRRRGADKTTVINTVLDQLRANPPDFVFVAGDDATDEGVFAMLDDGAIHGHFATRASGVGEAAAKGAGGVRGRAGGTAKARAGSVFSPSIVELRAETNKATAPPSPAARAPPRVALRDNLTFSAVVGRAPSCANYRIANPSALTICLCALAATPSAALFGRSAEKSST